MSYDNDWHCSEFGVGAKHLVTLDRIEIKRADALIVWKLCMELCGLDALTFWTEKLNYLRRDFAKICVAVL